MSGLAAELAELLDLDATERARRLRAIAAEDPTRAGRLERLLAADETAAGPLERMRPPLAAIADRALGGAAAPTRVGAWRLVDRLGAGGMGEVWRGERTEGGFAQQAAVKLVRAGMSTEQVVARFELERQLLARLRHPSIATLFDGGVAPDGRPWFAMELVEGRPLAAHVRESALGPEATIRLFLDVCDAVDFAHRSLVVHRDLKPSNVLVTPAGQVKLLDFGLAKLLEPELDPRLTRTEMRVLTPAYAAPEQVRGEPVTTATDVYSLGVMLYELLTDSLPHERKAPTPAGLEDEVSRETVERPSSRVRRVSGAARKARRLEGDLDTIVLQAMHRDPARRYASAAALGDDLRRHLDRQPVSARRDSARYRTGRFLRRHRLALTAALLVIASLVGGLSVALVQARRARAEAARARAEADRATKETMANTRAHRFYESILHDASPVLRERSEPLTILGAVRLAEERVDEVFADAPGLRAYFLLMFGGIELMNDDLPRAEPLLVRGLAAAREIKVERPEDATLVAEAHRNLGDLRRKQRRLDEAEALLQDGLRIAEGAVARYPDDPHHGNWLIAATLNSLLAQLYNDRGHAADGIPLLERTLVLKARYEGPEALSWGLTYYHLAMAQSGGGRHAEAEANLTKALERHALHLKPEDVRFAFLYHAGADIAAARGDLETALARGERGLAIVRGAGAPGHPAFPALLCKTGELLRRLERGADARARLAQALAAAERAASARDIGHAHRSLGLLDAKDGRTESARAHFAAARPAFARHYGQPHPLLAEVDALLAAGAAPSASTR